LADVRKAQDAEEILRAFATHAEEEIAGLRWSYHRDFGRSRLLVLDSRGGRVLDEDHRDVLSEQGGRGSRTVSPAISSTADRDDAAVAAVPRSAPPGSLDDAVCDGPWGRTAARLAEKIRQVDRNERRGLRAALTRSAAAVARLLALGVRRETDLRQPDRHPAADRPGRPPDDREDSSRGLGNPATAPTLSRTIA
jgi:hypothetical protein